MRWRAAADGPPVTSWWSRRSAWLLVAVVALGCTGTGLAATALHNADRERVTRALTEQTTLVTTMAAAEIRRYTDFLTDLAAALGAQERIEAAEFAATLSGADRNRLPGASSVSLVVPTSIAGIPAVQAFWRARGAGGLTLRPAGAADEHYFIVLSRSLDTAPSSVGRDLSAAPEASEAMRTARLTGRVTTSRSYRLLRDALLPPEQRQLSFVLAVPVVAASPAASDVGRFRGWLVMGLRGRDFLQQTIGRAAGDRVAVTLADRTADGSTTVAAWQPAAGVDAGTAPRTATLTPPQRTWRLTIRPTDRLLPATDAHRGLAALLIGGTITALLGALTRTLLTSRAQALRRVAEATAALREDITRREAVEAQLRVRETELKGFAGAVAHDLRNPLARITGYADVLREYAGLLPASDRNLFDRLHTGTRQMQTLVDDLLDYATADNRNLQPVSVDLADLVGQIVHDRVPPDSDPRPTVTTGPLPTVEGDRTLLRQVFDNLIGNALKYTRPGEPPRISVEALPAAGGAFRIEVRDNGIGLPAGQRDAVFDAFVRAPGSEAYPGTGLGLAIVHRIVERHGGRIGVEDNPGGGTCFWFTLPATRAAALSTATTAAQPSTTGD